MFSAVLISSIFKALSAYAAIELPHSPFLGGAGGVVANDSNAFSLAVKNISQKHRKDFVVGKSLFNENWVIFPASVKTRGGLGPLFNAQSCSSCHLSAGRGAVPTSAAQMFQGILIRVSDASGKPLKAYGDQLQNRANAGIPAEADPRVSYEEVKGKFTDGSEYTLYNPKYEFRELKYGNFPEGFLFSPRMAPAMHGLGLLEAIPESQILAHAIEKPNGVHGKANYVWDVRKKTNRLGRFGWKANQPTVEQQIAGAFNGDIGITSELFPNKSCTEVQKECSAALHSKRDLNTQSLNQITRWAKLLAVPNQRHHTDEKVIQGAQLFSGDAACASCHVHTYTTGKDGDLSENSNQKIHPFTDLLLHDMGTELADNRPDNQADGKQWRTAPLWGLGLVKAVSGDLRLMHDGRARSIEEAILWHDGEASYSKQQFLKMKKEDRQNLIHYLESL